MIEHHDPVPAYLLDKIRIMADCDDVRTIPVVSGYALTRTGRVFSVKMPGNHPALREIPRELTIQWDGRKHGLVALSVSPGVSRMFTLARLLLLTFGMPPPSPSSRVTYKDGDSTNLELDNLEWTTHSRIMHRVLEANGGAFNIGHRPARQKLTEAQVMEIRERHSNGEQFSILVRDYGVSPRTITMILNNMTWKHLPPASTRHKVYYGRPGSGCALTKLTEEDVLEIKSRIARNENMSVIARQKGVTPATIGAIKSGKTWKHV